MDEIEDRLRSLESEKIEPNIYETEEKKLELVRKVGPRTAKNILNARKDYKESRIPFLFSSIHPQLVIDVLHNKPLKEIEKLLEKEKEPFKKI